MSGGTDAAAHLFHVVAAGEQEGDPVAMFDPGMAGLSNLLVHAKDVQQFGPEPFRGIDPADELKIIDVEAFGMGIDLRSFFYCGVVFPQYEKGIRVLFEFGKQAEGCAGGVYGYWCRAGGIDGDRPDGLRCGGAGFLEAGFDGIFESFDVVEGMLSESVPGGVAVETVFPTGI